MRIFLTLFVAISLWLVSNAEKPNIVIIFTDDQGYADLGCYDSKTNKTPDWINWPRRGLCLHPFTRKLFADPRVPLCWPGVIHAGAKGGGCRRVRSLLQNWSRVRDTRLSVLENGRKKRNKIFFMSEKAIEYKLMKGRILVNRGMRWVKRLFKYSSFRFLLSWNCF